MRRIRSILIVVVPIAGLLSIVAWNEVSRLERARYLMASGQFAEALPQLDRYLSWFPGDAAAHMNMAEALIKDESQPEANAVRNAISHLEHAQTDPAFRVAAGIQAGRVQFLLLTQPFDAEHRFQDALQIEPENFEANWLMWKLLDVTMRAHLSEPHFWKCYERAKRADRPALLRDWYLSQFSPGTANASIDHMMGIQSPDESPHSRIELRRLALFRDEQQTWPQAHAAFAAWCHLEGAHELAREAIDESIEMARNDPFYLATVILVRINSGDFGAAQAAFGHWPESDRGFDYWKSRGLVSEEVRGDDGDAADAFQRALKIWPGHCDASLQHRRSNCLMRLGRKDEAAECREAACRIDDLMELDLHTRLRRLLVDLTSRTTSAEMAEFYRQLGRHREADEWQNLVTQSFPNK